MAMITIATYENFDITESQKVATEISNTVDIAFANPHLIHTSNHGNKSFILVKGFMGEKGIEMVPINHMDAVFKLHEITTGTKLGVLLNKQEEGMITCIILRLGMPGFERE